MQKRDAAYVKRCGEKCWQDGECDGSCEADAAELTGPEQGEAQGVAAASRSRQGALDGTAPSPGPASSDAALLRDEATDLLLGRLEAQPSGSLTIHVEHGTYLAEYDGSEHLMGVWLPNLTDALNSLIGRLT